MTIPLTLHELKQMEPGKVFASGLIENSPKGIYMTDHRPGDTMLWVAKRGRIHDWAIYTHFAEHGKDYVLKHGEKVTFGSHIKKLVPCDDEAFSMYRF
jgi:hypothetical protein